MKEMTIEEKAKAYDKALERARALNNGEDIDIEAGTTTCEYIFPELKESEDEKVEKAIFGMVYDSDNELWSSYDVSKSDVLTWLEKQGEQKSDSFCKEHCKGFQETGKCFADGDCKAKREAEQKPAWSEEDEDAIGMAIIALEDMYDEDTPNTTYGGYNLPFNKAAERLKSLKGRVQTQPKYVWSEEDEEYINDLIGVFDGQQYQAHSDEEVVNWLKSIRLQYNKEWGKRDEEMLKSIIATCELACEDRDSSPARHLLKMQTNWLKSLKQEIGWEPSEEQMEALAWALSLAKNYGEECAFDLRTLYEHLKKLKGE